MSGDENKLDDKFNFFEKIVGMVSKYGIKKVIASIFVFMLFIMTMIVFVNQKTIVQKIIQEQKVAIDVNNAKKLQFRVKEVNPRVDAILYKLLNETGAARSFVIEMHNGVDNPSGLPFVYGEMTYEKVSNDTLKSIIDDYYKLNLARYPMATYLAKNRHYFGSIEGMYKIDDRLTQKLLLNDVENVGLYSIRGNDIEIGFVGIIYYTPIPGNPERVEGCLLDASQRLSILLDISNNIDK